MQADADARADADAAALNALLGSGAAPQRVSTDAQQLTASTEALRSERQTFASHATNVRRKSTVVKAMTLTPAQRHQHELCLYTRRWTRQVLCTNCWCYGPNASCDRECVNCNLCAACCALPARPWRGSRPRPHSNVFWSLSSQPFPFSSQVVLPLASNRYSPL